MKKFIYIISALFLAIVMVGCEDDDRQDLASQIGVPSDLGLEFNITQDNSGSVTISPSGANVSRFEVFYGDGTGDSIELDLGENAQRTYEEGNYQVRLVAYSLSGESIEFTRELVVSFRAPENLAITVTRDPASNFVVNVAATADFATSYSVTFGEDPALAPVTFMEGESVDYTYSSTGTFDVTVTAFSGGAAVTTGVEMITVTDPVELPITFDSPTLNYNLSFFNSTGGIIDNPDRAIGGNNSEKVVSIQKTADVFGGVIVPASDPIDFTTLNGLRMKVWSPMPVGTKVTVKLETVVGFGGPATRDYEAFTTKQGEWESLFFDMSDIDTTIDFTQFVIFFDLGNQPTGDINYFDTIELADGAAFVLPMTFENPDVNYANFAFNNASVAVVSNPFPGGINTSSTVTEFVRPATGGFAFPGVVYFPDEPLNFTTNGSIFKVKVYSTRPNTRVLFKIENASDGGNSEELAAVTTTTNQWEELVFDFSSLNIDTNRLIQNIVLFFDPEPAFANPQTYYFDDVTQSF
ncbi:MAG: PKD domain-containing protein [Nonlabens sp.]